MLSVAPPAVTCSLLWGPEQVLNPVAERAMSDGIILSARPLTRR